MAERREYCPTNEKQIPAKGENRWNCSNFCWVTLEIWLQIQRIGRRRGRLGEAGGGSWLIFCCDPIPYKASCNKTRLYLQSTSNLCFQYNTYLHLDRRWQCLAYFHGSSYPFFIPVSMCVCVCVSSSPSSSLSPVLVPSQQHSWDVLTHQQRGKYWGSVPVWGFRAIQILWCLRKGWF